jgi:hypothetical protein
MSEFVIPPPANPVTTTRRVRLVVDSADRNRDLFPTPAEYEVRFEDDIEDVVAAELVRAHVPLSALVVGADSNALTVRVGAAGAPVDVVVPPGDYAPAGLAAALEAALSAGPLPAATVTYDPQRDAYAIACAAPTDYAVLASAPRRGFDGSVSRDYPDGSMAQTLGFPVGEHASDAATGELRAPCRRNFDLNRYAVLDIEPGFNVNRAVNAAVNNSFAVLGPGQGLGDFDRPVKRFEPPIPKLARLRIAWKDRRGRRYDFQNQDHRLELVLHVLKHGQSS